MTDTWAAKVLADVPKMTSHGHPGASIEYDDALAAIAKLGAGDDMVEAGRSADTMRKMAEVLPMGSAIRIAAFAAADTITDLLARIAALTAQVAEKEEHLVSVLQREAATQQRHDAKMEAAEAAADALTEARAEALREAAARIRKGVAEGCTSVELATERAAVICEAMIEAETKP